MSRFLVESLPITGLNVVVRAKIGDQRGFLTRLFCDEELASAGWNGAVAQINHTYTATKGTVRGLHFQRPPFSEQKLVSCIKGEVWDLAVDLRAGSPTFLHYHAEIVSAENRRALLIPEGFAHGFQTLTDNVEIIYCHSQPYNADAEAGLNPYDEKLAITWPLTLTEISERDRNHPLMLDQFTGLENI
jgi:dTDP-4-dehydrorhamnose 3,5-epimerase